MHELGDTIVVEGVLRMCLCLCVFRCRFADDHIFHQGDGCQPAPFQDSGCAGLVGKSGSSCDSAHPFRRHYFLWPLGCKLYIEMCHKRDQYNSCML